MSQVKGKVGKIEIRWRTVPTGPRGSAFAEIDGRLLEVSWRRDAQGIWIELPGGVHGFDISGHRGDDGGIRHSVSARNAPGEWVELTFVRAGEEATAAASGDSRRGARVRAQMPGKIIRVLTAEGAKVEKDQPLLVMEAMKMENEIRAPRAGKVVRLTVTEGAAVETGADLCAIEPS